MAALADLGVHRQALTLQEAHPALGVDRAVAAQHPQLAVLLPAHQGLNQPGRIAQHDVGGVGGAGVDQADQHGRVGGALDVEKRLVVCYADPNRCVAMIAQVALFHARLGNHRFPPEFIFHQIFSFDFRCHR